MTRSPLSFLSQRHDYEIFLFKNAHDLIIGAAFMCEYAPNSHEGVGRGGFFGEEKVYLNWQTDTESECDL